MGIQSAMYSGVSGLNTNSQAMTVIGNNLANTNTLGFKGSRSVFSDLLSSNVFGSGGSSQVGRGVGLSTVDSIFSQGTFETTSSGTDVAIEGDGFFVLKEDGNDTAFYSRAGAFRFNEQGYLINPEGLIVQGKLFDPVDNDTLLPEDPSNIQVGNVGLIPASATSELTFTTNLDENSTERGAGNKMVTADILAPTNAAMTGLTINGIAITPTTATTSAGKVAEINAQSAATGVTATQSGNFKVSSTATSAFGTVSDGDLTVNGIPIGAIAAGTDAATQAANAATAINLATGLTGVTATVGTGTNGAALNALILANTNTNSAAITVAFAGTATSALTGLEAGTMATGENGTITLYSDFDSTDIVIGTAGGTIGFTDATQTLTMNSGIDPADKTTYNYSASSQIYDSLGESHLITVYWRLVEDSTNTWNMGYTVGNDNTLPIGVITDPLKIPSGPLDLTFDSKGNLVDTDGDGTSDPITATITLPAWTNGAATPQTMELSFNCTQYDSDSVVIGQIQNGYGAGELTNVAINSDGVAVASYSNGRQINIAQLVLAKFQNTGGLKLAGSNRYIASDTVGTIRVGLPGPELGRIFTNSLEQSNVDMGQEFVKMITTQRGFQANSKIITTVDEMLGELINLKR